MERTNIIRTVLPEDIAGVVHLIADNRFGGNMSAATRWMLERALTLFEVQDELAIIEEHAQARQASRAQRAAGKVQG